MAVAAYRYVHVFVFGCDSDKLIVPLCIHRYVNKSATKHFK